MADSETDICNLALLKAGDNKGFIDDLLEDTSTEAQTLRIVYPQKRDLLLKTFKGWQFSTRRAYPAQLGGALYDPTKNYGVGDCASFVPSPDLVANMPSGCSTTFVYLSIAANNLGNEPDSSPTFWRQISRPEWDCIFQLPVDVLEVHGVYPDLRNPREDQKVPYSIEVEPAPGPGRILLTDGSWPGRANTPLQRQIGLIYTAQITDTALFPVDFTEALAWDLAEEVCLSIRKNADEAKRCREAGRIARGEASAAARREKQVDPAPLPSWIAARHGGSRRHR